MAQQQKVILFVEDEEVVLDHYKKSLVSAGYQVIEASDGEEGLRLAEEKKPDLIILDLLLPKKDGMTVLKELRLKPWGRRMPVIIVSNLDSSQIISEATELGVYHYLVKSQWSIDDVVLKVGLELTRR